MVLTKTKLFLLMNTLQTNLTHSFSLTKLSSPPTQYKSNVWDGSLIKKFITPKWPYELYKGSLMRDLMSVLLSPIGK